MNCNIPEHYSITIDHNVHKKFYDTVEYMLDNSKRDELDSTEDMYEFISEEDKQKCIDTNDMWTVTLYPKNAVGFYSVAGSNINELLEFAFNNEG